MLGESGPFLVLAGDEIFRVGYMYEKDMVGYIDEENGTFFGDLSEALLYANRISVESVRVGSIQ